MEARRPPRDDGRSPNGDGGARDGEPTDAELRDEPSPVVLWLLFSPLVALLWIGALALIWWWLR